MDPLFALCWVAWLLTVGGMVYYIKVIRRKARV